MSSDLLTPQEAATRLGVSVAYLSKARMKGVGPVFAKLGTRVRYRPEALDAWLQQNSRQCSARTAAVANGAEAGQ